MPSSPADRDALIAAVEKAFGAVERGTITLHEAEVIDSYGTVDERQKARKHDPETDWRDVPDTSLRACQNALPHLDPASWRFYLPAFLRFALRTLDDRVCLVDRVIYTLALGGDRRMNDHARARFTTLNARRAQVVRDFLELARDDDDRCDARVASQALDDYWRRATST